jgi:predicted DCC family thiol-disulfide oxidoreductase YuxK
MWVDFWRGLTGDRVEYVPYQKAGGRFPAILVEDFRRAVHYVTPDGRRFSGAEAVAELLSRVSGYEWMLWVCRHVPGCAALAEFVYRFVALHRNAGYRITRALWGERIERPTYHMASALFARALALIYMVAFASFGMQVRGLVGTEGILPVPMYLQFAVAQLGSSAYWRVPTIFWWAPSDFALLSIAWGGVALAAVATIARPHSGWQRTVFAILFVYYLSIVSAGQIFMSYQWDLLLLEAGFLAIFLRPSLPRVWLFQWLLFRLMFQSGLVKLLSHDASWHNLTALTFHYWTQPLPNFIAWYMAQLPEWFQKASVIFTFAVELGLPILMFGPRRLKQVAALGTIALQVLIILTGNYTFFNYLAIALCLFLLDDQFFAGKKRYVPMTPAWSNRYVSAALFLFIMTVSCTELVGMRRAVPSALNRIVDAQAPFDLVNSYGLFAAMTTSRPEIEIEGSKDGQNWQPYVFRYKAGPLNRAPGWVAPFQPRLDWQMWFAALGNYRENPWFLRFMLRLLEGSKPVLALMERDPFGGVPPAHIRAMVYDYRFTTWEERRKTGDWWKRELKGVYFPPVSLRGKNMP